MTATGPRHRATGEGQEAIEAFLRAHGADGMPHPGGTLLEHLRRVQSVLADWGADAAVRTAGLCHATYGTDGFAPKLLPVTERATLVALIGERAESLVHLYASCDRDAVYPRIDGTTEITFRNRFTGEEHRPAPEELRAFLEITAANELDVMAHNAELAEKYGLGLHDLLTRAGSLLSLAARQACDSALRSAS
ncbi:DUF6817 domain-containing protein [Streptomyces sp. V3I7]|uniref:DUF6817 domain-containing protein n=1 Tax=Streptomyces sp. V3I7 TaxID=3042278 RepID=UPI00278076E5|nr:hypothetical protein [Streptomyces sp. V3I7]MDQ0994668.1 hypothetical protein [Streptomyces sp. V3I7]